MWTSDKSPSHSSKSDTNPKVARHPAIPDPRAQLQPPPPIKPAPPRHPHPSRNPAKNIPPTLPTISPIRRTIDPVSSQPGPESEKPPATGRALQPPQPPLTSLLSRFWPQAIENRNFSQFYIAQTAENKQLLCRIYLKYFFSAFFTASPSNLPSIFAFFRNFAPEALQNPRGPTARCQKFTSAVAISIDYRRRPL